MLPKNRLLNTDLTEIIASDVPRSGHEVSKVTFSWNDTQLEGYFKICSDKDHYPAILASHEVLFSVQYRLATQNAATVLPVYDDEEKMIGVVSITLPNFKSINAEKNLTKDDLIKANIAEVLVASYFYEEDDMHPDNFGLQGRIDFDMSGYLFTHLIKGKRLINETWVLLSTEICWEIVDPDIVNFPNCLRVTPCYWPAFFPKNGNIQKDCKWRPLFQALAKDPQFIKQKFTAFMQLLFIIKEIREKNLRQSSTDETCIQIQLTHFEERRQQLYKVLMNCADFKVFLKNDVSWEELRQYAIELGLSENQFEHFACQLWRDSLQQELIFNLHQILDVANNIAKNDFTLILPSNPLDETIKNVPGRISPLLESVKNSECLETAEQTAITALLSSYKSLVAISQSFYDKPMPTLGDIEKFKNEFILAQVALDASISPNDSQALQSNLTTFINKLVSIKDKIDSSQFTQTTMEQSFYFTLNRPKAEEVDPVKALIAQTHSWLSQNENYDAFLTLIEKVKISYSPAYNLVRQTRIPEIEVIITTNEANWPLDLFLKITSSGGWNSNTLLFATPSFNHQLICQLGLEVLSAFRSKAPITQYTENADLQSLLTQKVSWEKLLQNNAKEIRDEIIHFSRSLQLSPRL